MAILYVNSDNVVEVQSLTDAVSDTVITSATVKVTLKDSDGVNVVGETWPLTMTHVAAGTYRGTLIDSLSLTADTTVTGLFVADDGAGKHREWCESYIVTCSG